MSALAHICMPPGLTLCKHHEADVRSCGHTQLRAAQACSERFCMEATTLKRTGHVQWHTCSMGARGSPLCCEGGALCCGAAGVRQQQLRVGGHQLVGDGVPCTHRISMTRRQVSIHWHVIYPLLLSCTVYHCIARSRKGWLRFKASEDFGPLLARLEQDAIRDVALRPICHTSAAEDSPAREGAPEYSWQMAGFLIFQKRDFMGSTRRPEVLSFSRSVSFFTKALPQGLSLPSGSSSAST